MPKDELYLELQAQAYVGVSFFTWYISLSYSHKPAHMHPAVCLEDYGRTLPENSLLAVSLVNLEIPSNP